MTEGQGLIALLLLGAIACGVLGVSYRLADIEREAKRIADACVYGEPDR